MKYKPGKHVVSTKHKFKPGDRVTICQYGCGFSPSELGICVTITDLVADYAYNNPGYHIREPYGNNRHSSDYARIVGESSFEFVNAVDITADVYRTHYLGRNFKMLTTVFVKFHNTIFTFGPIINVNTPTESITVTWTENGKFLEINYPLSKMSEYINTKAWVLEPTIKSNRNITKADIIALIKIAQNSPEDYTHKVYENWLQKINQNYK